MNKSAIFFNPSAGKGRSKRIESDLKNRLKACSIPHDFFITKNEEHLRLLTQKKSSTHSALIGCGGDSTVGIMIDEMMKKKISIPFGLIATGSSNDIAREFGVESLDAACKAIKNHSTKRIDLGAVYHDHTPLRFYIGQANIGLGSHVARYVEDLAKKRPFFGKQQVIAGILGIRNSIKTKNHLLPLRIKSKGQETQGRFMIAVFNNIKYWATGKILDPSSRPDDGLLNCCLVESCSLRRLISLTWLSQKQKLHEASEIRFLKASKFTVQSEKSFIIQVDGELIGGFENPQLFHDVSFQIHPSSAEIIC